MTMTLLKLLHVSWPLALALSISIQGSIVTGQCFKSEESASATEQPSSGEQNADYQASFYERQLDFSLDMFHKLYNKVCLIFRT